jgi:hypothetical protein
MKQMHWKNVRRRIPNFIFLAAIISGAATTDTRAQAGEDTIQVAARSISFLRPALSGPVTAAIIYQPGDPGSEREARTIEQSLARNGRIGSISLTPRRVASDTLDGLAGAKVAFVTHGTDYRQVGRAAAARSILTISFDMACVRDGQCVLAISSRPAVQIIISKAATTAAKLKFSSGFLMLIKEI